MLLKSAGAMPVPLSMTSIDSRPEVTQDELDLVNRRTKHAVVLELDFYACDY